MEKDVCSTVTVTVNKLTTSRTFPQAASPASSGATNKGSFRIGWCLFFILVIVIIRGDITRPFMSASCRWGSCGTGSRGVGTRACCESAGSCGSLGSGVTVTGRRGRTTLILMAFSLVSRKFNHFLEFLPLFALPLSFGVLPSSLPLPTEPPAFNVRLSRCVLELSPPQVSHGG